MMRGQRNAAFFVWSGQPASHTKIRRLHSRPIGLALYDACEVSCLQWNTWLIVYINRHQIDVVYTTCYLAYMQMLLLSSLARLSRICWLYHRSANWTLTYVVGTHASTTDDNTTLYICSITLVFIPWPMQRTVCCLQGQAKRVQTLQHCCHDEALPMPQIVVQCWLALVPHNADISAAVIPCASTARQAQLAWEIQVVSVTSHQTHLNAAAVKAKRSKASTSGNCALT